MKGIHQEKRKIASLVLTALLVSCVSAAPQAEAEQDAFQLDNDVNESQRDDKVFIALIKIPPDQCTTDDATNSLGTCMPSSECSNRGGTASGSCSNGLGTCCLVTRTCNSETSLNNTYFVSPDLSSTSTVGACSVTINRATSNICQIRLDFTVLKLSDPDGDGACTDDFLAVTGGNMQVPLICGTNDGQHMYIDVEPNGGALRLTVDRAVQSLTNRNWNIKVTQISCDSKYKAPAGCLQYYTDTSGTVSSFNYVGKALTTSTETTQLKDQNYGVCIKKAAGYCGIIWERDPSSDYSFTVSQSTAGILPDLIGNPAASSKEATNCPTDYVIIPEGVDDTGVQADRYCGLGFPLSVTSTATPFVLYVKTDSNETPDGGNLGFSLLYRQTTSC